MKCSNCGTELSEKTKFCTNCGKPVENTSMEQIPPVQVPTQEPIITGNINDINNGNVIPNQQPPKKNNTLVIVICSIVGVFVLFSIVSVVVISLVAKNIISDVEDLEDYNETSEKSEVYSDKKDGEVIKEVKDPTGHTIKIIKDSISVVRTDTSYLYDVAEEIRKSAKLAKKVDIDNTDYTETQKEATKKAIDYFNNSIFDLKSMREDLTEKYDEETAKFAIEHAGVDMKEQTKIKAYQILASGGFSKKELYDLLVFEEYNEEDIKEIVEDENIDYYEQAVRDACFYKYTERNYGGSYTKKEAEDSLNYGEYTLEEIEFALKVVYDEMDD